MIRQAEPREGLLQTGHRFFLEDVFDHRLYHLYQATRVLPRTHQDLIDRFDRATEKLTPKERGVIKYFYGIGFYRQFSLAEISEGFNMSEEELDVLVTHAMDVIITNSTVFISH